MALHRALVGAKSAIASATMREPSRAVSATVRAWLRADVARLRRRRVQHETAVHLRVDGWRFPAAKRCRFETLPPRAVPE